MRRKLGIEVTQHGVRAAVVQQSRGRVRVLATHVAPLGAGRTLDDALVDIAAALALDGRLRCGVAPSPADTWLKLVALPPLGDAERARMLELEAERYFPVRGEAVIADAPKQGPVAAVRAAAAEALATRVEETLGVVETLEPAPRAVVRTWAALDPTLRGAHFALLTRDGPWWEVVVAQGSALLGYARLYGPGAADAAAALAAAVRDAPQPPRVLVAGAAADAIEEVRAALAVEVPGAEPEARADLAVGVPAHFAAAVGLALAPAGGLLPEAQRQRLRQGSRRRTAAWVAATAAAGVLFIIADIATDARAASALEQQTAAVQPQAEAAAADLERARQALATVEFTDSLAAMRPDWLGVLGELGARLPDGAYVTHFRGRADEGNAEIRGYARRASSIVPLLEQSARFQEVESLETISRRTVGGVELENFSLRFQVAP